MEALKKEQKQKIINNENIPRHIGLIMDGNRRWGKKHGLSRKPIEGTKVGRDALFKAVEYCAKREIKHVTAWAFSTENWRRSESEVSYLLDLLRNSIEDLLSEAKDKSLKINFIGRLSDLPDDIRESIARVEETTRGGKALTLNMAVSYGGHAEIVDATKKIIDAGLRLKDVTEKKFAEYIYEAGQPEIDLIVRTGGAIRLSGFMLWQSSYSELYFTDTLWPDFNELELDKALDYFAKAKRNFGK